jgi:transposase-like protein
VRGNVLGIPSRKTLEMVGKKYGHLTVLRINPAKYQPGGKHVVVRCDCGRIYDTRAARVRDGVSSCCSCGRDRSADTNRQLRSVKLPSGQTVGEVASAAGLKCDTVYARWRRGWPEKDLGAPPLQRGSWHKGTATRVRKPVTLPPYERAVVAAMEREG